MPWHQPKTWRSGDMRLVASILNYEVRDLLTYLYDELLGPDYATGWIGIDGGVGYTNGWVDYGGSSPVGEYRREGNRVYLRGRVKDGTVPLVMFTLPADFRPATPARFAVDADEAYGSLLVLPDGRVFLTSGSNVSVYLDGVIFRVN